MTHLDEERLFQLALGQLEPAAQAEAEEHLGLCELCRRRHENLSSIVFARTTPGSAPPGQPTRPDRPTEAREPGRTLERGTALGRYVLLEKLGAGGMGEVFAAFDPQLDRRVALKLLRGGALSLEEGRARLLREAQAMARLQHPNVIAVHDVGTIDDRVFIAMEFIEGDTIGEWLRGDRTWEAIIELFRQAGAGLAAAHRAGLVHRDFKPDNVLLSADGRPRVLDFGLARASTSTPAAGTKAGDVPEGLADSPLAQPLTRDGAVMGTPGYMAPEQLAGLPTDARSDQYSFCVALYEALFGKRPFGGATLKQHALEMASNRVPPPPSGSTVPSWVFEVLVRGLQADPASRWPDMDALLTALTPRRERRRGLVVAVVSLAVLAVIAVGFGLWTRQRLLVCGGQDRALAGVWDQAQRRALQAVFARSHLAFSTDAWASVEKTVDAWALEWVSTAREACEATKVRKVDSAELLELRRSCLDGKLDELRALVSVFAQGDREVIVNAPFAAKSLDAPQACLTRAPTRAIVDEQTQAAERGLRQSMSDALALYSAGKYQPAAQRLRPALAVAASDRTLAEAQLLLGKIDGRLSDVKGALAAHRAAAEHAVKAAEPALEAVAYSRLSANEGFDADSDDAAELFDHLAQAAASRVADNWEVAVELARNESLVELRRKRFRSALTDLERALTLQREHLPLEHPEVASTLNNIGYALSLLRRFDEAIRVYQQALAIHEAVEGPVHPNTATSAHNLGVTFRLVGREGDAKVALTRALEARRQALGPTHPDTLTTQLILAQLCTTLGQLDEAAALLTEVLRAREAAGPSRELVAALQADAELALAGRFFREAEARAKALLEVAQVTGEARDRFVGLVLDARALTGLGDWADARARVGAAAAVLAERDDKRRDEREAAELEEARAQLDFAQGHLAEAKAAWQRALVLRESSALGVRPRAWVLMELCRTELDLGQYEAAAANCSNAVEALEATQLPADLARAQLLLGVVHLHDRDGGAGSELASLVERLSVGERAALGAWLKGHGVSLGTVADGGAR